MTFDAQFIEFDLILHPRFRRIIRHKNQLLPFGSKVRHCFVNTFENSVSFPDYTVAVEEEGIIGFEELHSIGVREDVCWHCSSDCEVAGSERGEKGADGRGWKEDAISRFASFLPLRDDFSFPTS